MASIVDRLNRKKLIHCPQFLPSNTHYEVIMGSAAYGVSSNSSDLDVYGFCIPPKEYIFPEAAGNIIGFDKNIKTFDVWQQHHIKTDNKEYDLSIYNVVKYFRLCANGNPNMIDSLFVPANCILHMSRIGNIVRDSRKDFLSKKCWHTFKGYAYQQMSKMRKKSNAQNPKRAADIAKYGYDLKFAYHIVRLLNEVEQILVDGDIDLQLNRKQLQSIRNGEWKLEDIEGYFSDKEKSLEKIYLESNAVPHNIQEGKIKSLLVNVLEEHYETLENFHKQTEDRELLREIKELVKNV